jgi:uncharacterized protein YbjT (DUF2867 family)
LKRGGAEIVIADLYDPQQLMEAMRGTQRAYFVPPMQPYMIQAATAFAVAAQDAKLEAIVQMSQWTSHPAHPSLMTRQTWLVDRMFSMIPGVGHVIVNPGYFADNILRVMDFAALLGILPVLTGTSSSAPVSNEDIARVVATLLANPTPHLGRSYRPTGPKLISGREAAEIMQNVLGNRVRPFDLPRWMFLKVARMQGVDPFQVYSLLDYLEDHKRGVFAFEGGVNNVVEELPGAPAETFETTVRRYATMPFTRRTLGNRLRAFVNFNLTPFYPGYNMERYAREHEFPEAIHPQLSADSEFWRSEHTSKSPQPATTL